MEENYKSKEYENAKLSSRIMATFIDYGFFFLIVYVYMIFFGQETEDGYQVKGFAAIPIVAGWIIYFVLMEWKYSTIGHQILGLFTIQINNQKTTLKQTFARRCFDPIDIFVFFGLIGFLVAKSNENNQRVGDLVANVKVVKK